MKISDTERRLDFLFTKVKIVGLTEEEEKEFYELLAIWKLEREKEIE